LIASANVARANVGETYGFGSQSSALAGATAAWGYGGFATYSNPAMVVRTGEKRLLISYSLLSMFPKFLPIESVVTEAPYVSGAQAPVTTSVDNQYRTTWAQTLALSYRFLPNFYKMTFGFQVTLPVDSVAYLDTGETFVPEYVLYRSRTQRPQALAALSADLGKGLSAGLGAHLGFSLTSRGTIYLKNTSPQSSTMRFTSSLVPRLAPYFGIGWTNSPENPRDLAAGSASLGLVVRFPVTSPNTMALRSGVQIVSSDLTFNFTARSALFYDPLIVELGGSIQIIPLVRVFAQVDFQGWNAFSQPALKIEDAIFTDNCPTGTICGLDFQGTKLPTFSTRNILLPKAGVELTPSDKLSIRFGAAYRPSIFSALPTEAGNYLDPDKIMLNAGTGIRFKSFLGFDTPCDVDFHIAYHHLIPRTVQKTAGDEAGNVASAKIGAPRYVMGGAIFGGGLSVNLAF